MITKTNQSFVGGIQLDYTLVKPVQLAQTI